MERTPTVGESAASPSARFDLRLGVVSHVPHWPANGGAAAYEPYVRELEIWARLFSRVDVVAPVAEWRPRGFERPYGNRNIRWRPVRFSNWPGRRRHLLRSAQLPAVRRELARLYAVSDVVLLRSPAVISIVARAMARANGASTITKYAGAFRPFPGEALETRLERFQIARARRPTLVYGPADEPHLIPFIPALMSSAELRRAKALAGARVWEPPWQLLGVGRLSPEKRLDLALRGLAELATTRRDLEWEFTLVGDGVEASLLRDLARELGIGRRVRFAGALSFERVQEELARAHVLVASSAQEGWAKTIVEAWAHGAVAVAAPGAFAPAISAEDVVAFEPTPAALASVLARLLDDPAGTAAIAAHGPQRCAGLTLEAFETRLERVLVEVCGLS